MDELLERGRNWLAGVLIVASLGAAVGLAYPLLQRPSVPPVQLVSNAPAGTPAAVELQVHVTGAVEQPGLYAVAPGSRVADVVQAAGAAADADLDALNLAARLADGQRLVVPRQGEPPAVGAAPASRGAARPAPVATPAPGSKLNLNAATATQLDTLPGIGPTLANRIVDYRARNGPFRAPEQLRDAKLIPAATYERIKDLVTVE
jgi:competence protein ComEA